MASSPGLSPKFLCIHHNDADGRASAAIVRRALGEGVCLYEINYGQPTPWNLISTAQEVIIVDFALPYQDMANIAAQKDITWIDHHISAINALVDISSNWKGIRDSAEAACVLTWKYYFPEIPIPRSIILIGDRDIWRMEELETKAFSHGLRQYSTKPENDALWQPLLDDDRNMIESLAKKGQGLLESYMNYLRGYVKRYAFEAVFEGYRTLCVNRPGEGELIEIICDMGYEVAYCYADSSVNNQLMTVVMIGSRVIDVSKVAEKFGGGGHLGAAGFRFERNGSPFPPTAGF